MGKVKEIAKKGAAPQGQKKKITKPNTFGQYASNKASKKDKMLVNVCEIIWNWISFCGYFLILNILFFWDFAERFDCANSSC